MRNLFADYVTIIRNLICFIQTIANKQYEFQTNLILEKVQHFVFNGLQNE